LRAVAACATVLLLFCTLPGCQTNPATGKTNFNFLSLSDDIAIGAKMADEFTNTNGGTLDHAQINNYVSTLGKRLAEVSELPQLDWQFTVLDSQQINAFALPGGHVYMSRGLLEKMSNEAQLAGVLGHEIGHVTARHSSQRISQAMLVQGVAVGLAIGGAASDEDWLTWTGVGVGAGGGLYLLSFSRDNESEADSLGIRYMTKLGYNPWGQVQVMEILKEAAGKEGSKLEEFFSTHPLSSTRIERLSREIEEKYPGAVNNPSYVYNEAAFKRNVLDVLKTLPPPSDAKQSAADAFIEQHMRHDFYACDHHAQDAQPVTGGASDQTLLVSSH
jgi:predicted Zn-dependent protease